MNVTAGIMPAHFDLTITPAPLRGTVTPPPSKSQSHRILIAAALGTEKSRIGNLGRSEDIDATRRCGAWRP